MDILKVKTEKRKIGDVGESATVKYLKRHRYKILKRNYVACGKEIDIIAENRDYICFIEVKTRTAGKQTDIEPRPAAAVTPEKQRGIIICAKYFLGTYTKKKQVRLDVAEVFVDENKKTTEINYLEGAFTYNTAYSAKDAFRKGAL